MFTAVVEGAEELAHDWVNVRAAVRAGMRRGVSMGVKEGAAEARAKHRFKNRTGNLERSIVGEVTGSSDDEHRGQIAAWRKYASIVEHGRGPVEAKRAKTLHFFIGGQEFFRRRVGPATALPFMGIAYLKCEAVMIREIEIGIANAQVILNR